MAAGTPVVARVQQCEDLIKLLLATCENIASSKIAEEVKAVLGRDPQIQSDGSDFAAIETTCRDQLYNLIV